MSGTVKALQLCNNSPRRSMQEMQLEMADASALGPHRVGTLDAAHLCTAAFSSPCLPAASASACLSCA